MARAQYEHQCTHCTKTYNINQSWIDPQHYTNPEQAYLTTTFWCPKCERGQALRLRMLPDTKVEVIEQFVYENMINENSPSYYSPSKDREETEEDEEQIEGLTEKRALELLSSLH